MVVNLADGSFDTQDCVYDVAWNEAHENQVLAACGNGSLRLFDVTLQVSALARRQGELARTALAGVSTKYGKKKRPARR